MVKIPVQMLQLTCKQCAKDFTVRKAACYMRGVFTKKYCSRVCQHASLNIATPRFNCAECGAEASRTHLKKGGYNYEVKYCSRVCQYRAQFKGGSLDKHGYKVLKTNGKTVAEHRLVMEKIMGRPLFSEETVHPINGVRHDNRPENLELWSSRHGKGQRISDKVSHAKEILKMYEIQHIYSDMTGVMCGLMSLAA